MSESTINAGQNRPFDEEQPMNDPEVRRVKAERARKAAGVGEKADNVGVVDSEPVKK